MEPEPVGVYPVEGFDPPLQVQIPHKAGVPSSKGGQGTGTSMGGAKEVWMSCARRAIWSVQDLGKGAR